MRKFIAILGSIVLFPINLTGKTLEVGVALRFDDRFNTTVTLFREGIDTAKTLFEKTHPGIKINLQQFSHGPEMASVVQAAERIAKSGVPAVIGPEMSDEAIVMGDTLAPHKIVLVSHTASNPKVTDNKPFVFRTCFSDTDVAEKLADYVVAKLKPRKVGIVHNISSPYSDYLSTRFAEQLRKLSTTGNAPEIHVQKVLKRAQDYSQEIDFFMAKGVTHLVAFTYDTDFARFVLQSGKKGFFPNYIGSDGWGSNEYVFERLVKESEFGDKFNGIRNSYWKEDLKSPLANKFREAHKAKYHHTPNAWNAIAFDAAWVLFNAMARAKNPRSSEQIRSELITLSKLPLVTAERFRFGPDNSPKKELYLYKIAKDGVRYEATLR